MQSKAKCLPCSSCTVVVLFHLHCFLFVVFIIIITRQYLQCSQYQSSQRPRHGRSCVLTQHKLEHPKDSRWLSPTAECEGVRFWLLASKYICPNGTHRLSPTAGCEGGRFGPPASKYFRSNRTHWLSPTARYGGVRFRLPPCKSIRPNRTHWLSPTPGYGGVRFGPPSCKSLCPNRTHWLSPSVGYGGDRFGPPPSKYLCPKDIDPTEHSVFSSIAATANVQLWRPRHTSRSTNHSLAA
jgi:hypothetical protein